ncbi:hypothetical protein Tco_1019389 [Tanacetum coccineum]|uniref:Uncharacterized protein n=1 Tax=Tanacetum coccineum TaxID=301880 RepID=A0ABQ5FYP6_9ASTR
MEGERISNRCRGKKSVVEENTIDAAIDVDEEASDSDFEAVRVRGSNGETTDVSMRDTCADSEAGPSKVRKQKKKVDKFDPKAMEIKLKKGSLMVNKEVISEMLGLRNEGENILMNEVSDNEEMIKEWKAQFDVPKKDITPSIIKSEIRRSNVVDFNFKLNIIMLFANIFGCCKKTGSCELEILNHINRDTNMCNINWCQYVWDSLPNCKDGWRKELLNNFFCGHVTLLTMIYMDGVQCKSLQMVRKRPPTAAWSAEVLKERENEEIASGGFGLGEKEFPFLEEDENGFPEDLEGFAWKMGNYIETIRKSKNCFEKTLAIGLEVFPNDDVITDLEEKYIQVMRIQTDGGNSHNNFKKGNSSANMGKTPENDKAQERTSDRVELIGFDSPEYAFGPVTQAAVLETAEKVTSSKRIGKEVAIEDIPSFSFGVTQDFVEYESGGRTDVSTNVIQPINAMPVSFCPPTSDKNEACTRKEKRSTNLTAHMKSPFMSRVVNIDGVLSAMENRVSKILFKMSGDPL